MPNINNIRLSGTTYDIEDSGATKVMEVTQAQYDALPASAKTANIIYVITDATPVDVSQFVTSGDVNNMISGKQDSSGMTAYTTTATTNALNNTVTAHTANTTIHVTASDKSTWNGKQNAISDLSTIRSNASNAISQLGGFSIVKLTQSQYDALATKDNNTIYYIVG